MDSYGKMHPDRMHILAVYFLVMLLIAATSSAASMFFFLLRSQSFLVTVFLWVAFTLFVFIVLLRDTLKRDFYSYSNVVLIAGILFSAVFLITMMWYFFSCIGHTERMQSDYILQQLLNFPRRFSYFSVFVLSAISLALIVSNLSLIRHEGLCLTNLLGVVFGALYIGGTFVVYWLGDLIEAKLAPDGVWVASAGLGVSTGINLFILIMLCYFECIFFGTGIMSFAAARKVPSYDKDYIIILGCSIDKRGGLLPLLKQRTNRAIRFAWEQEIASGKPLKYVPSGGQGPDEVMSEGSAMELYLLSHGAEPDEVFPEKKSRNTFENLVFSKRIIDEMNPEAKIAYATTNFHIFRSGILANRAGLREAEGIASQTKWYFWPNGWLREFFAILTINKRSHLAMAAITAFSSIIIGLIIGSGMLH